MIRGVKNILHTSHRNTRHSRTLLETLTPASQRIKRRLKLEVLPEWCLSYLRKAVWKYNVIIRWVGQKYLRCKMLECSLLHEGMKLSLNVTRSSASGWIWNVQKCSHVRSFYAVKCSVWKFPNNPFFPRYLGAWSLAIKLLILGILPRTESNLINEWHKASRK